MDLSHTSSRLRLPKLSRIYAGVSLLLQLFVAGAVPLADARAEAVSRDAQAHVESTSDGTCVPAHPHSACVLCKVLRSAVDRVPLHEACGRAERAAPSWHSSAAIADIFRSGTLGARGPPSA